MMMNIDTTTSQYNKLKGKKTSFHTPVHRGSSFTFRSEYKMKAMEQVLNSELNEISGESKTIDQDHLNDFNIPLVNSADDIISTGDNGQAYDYDSDYWEDERNMLKWEARRLGLTYLGEEELQRHSQQMKLSGEEKMQYLMK